MTTYRNLSKKAGRKTLLLKEVDAKAIEMSQHASNLHSC